MVLSEANSGQMPNDVPGHLTILIEFTFASLTIEPSQTLSQVTVPILRGSCGHLFRSASEGSTRSK